MNRMSDGANDLHDEQVRDQQSDADRYLRKQAIRWLFEAARSFYHDQSPGMLSQMVLSERHALQSGLTLRDFQRIIRWGYQSAIKAARS